MLQSCDVAFVPLASSGLMDAVPSKLLEAWAHKLPVILVADGESRELVEACDGGFVYSPEFTDAIEEGISQYLGSHALQRRHACNGHRFVCENLSREELARKMEAVLEKVALGTRGSSNLRSERKTVSSSSH